MFKLACVGLVTGLLVFLPARAAEPLPPVQTYKMVREKSALKFVANTGSDQVKGTFEQFTLDVAFDPERLAESHIRVEVDTGSAHVDDAKMQAALLTSEWLNAEAAPKAIFVSESIDHIPNTRDYYAKGNLTLRGIKKPVTINFRQDFSDENAVVISGFSTLQRNDFGVGQGEWRQDDKVKYAVRVEFRIHALKQ